MADDNPEGAGSHPPSAIPVEIQDGHKQRPHHASSKSDSADTILPYASEQFGVYQPLIGWHSTLNREMLTSAVLNRVMRATKIINTVAHQTDQHPIGTVLPPSHVDRTNTMIGQELANRLSNNGDLDLVQVLADRKSMLSDIAKKSLQDVKTSSRQFRLSSGDVTDGDGSNAHEQNISNEASMAATLHYLAEHAPHAAREIFRPSLPMLNRIVGSAKLFTDASPARSAFLSPIGILHMFREYFFQLGTFLGPPVGHVWISPGGTVELIEVNTRRQLTEQTMEQSTETTNKTELDQTDRDELSDAVKSENANDTKLGVTATASGGFGSVFQASGSASFNLDDSRKQAQEQTHKKMREQSAKLSSEVRQNYKTTYRTVTETTDTSSKRYVLQNTSNRLVSYELSQKMRKLAVQIQDLGERLCWQLYIDNPGDPLGIGEFVHATGQSLDPSLKKPETKLPPSDQQKTFTAYIPFIQLRGGDDDDKYLYRVSPNDYNKGTNDDDAKQNWVQFTHVIQCPTAPPGYEMTQVAAVDFHGGAVEWDSIAPDTASAKFTIHLTVANWNGSKQLPFDVTVVYSPTQATKDQVKQDNEDAQSQYTDDKAHAQEKAFYDTLRTRLKLVGSVRARPQTDLREEERNMVYRRIIAKIYDDQGWTAGTDYHVASEMIRYFFDVDSMLYFVAPDWWLPRTQQLVSSQYKGEFQPTIIADPAISTRIINQGLLPIIVPGHRARYLITEETAPAPFGSSLGWLIQLDGDAQRNAFLNSPWVKAVLPIRPGYEREAIAFLQRPEVAGKDGLDQDYEYHDGDPPEWKGLSIKEVLLLIADKIRHQYEKVEMKPTPLDPGMAESKMALPTETVFAKGFDPLEGGIAFDKGAFQVFSQWTEVLPTDQIVATEYSLKGL